nr:ACT domain-containing protein [uncultured Arsenicibacter sp.]
MEHHTSYQHHVYQILGFDRIGFVGDLTNAIPADEDYRIMGMQLEGDGVRVKGHVAVAVPGKEKPTGLMQLMRSVPGVVTVKVVS